jgi:hypothetical protein
MARGRMLNNSVCGSKKFQDLPDDTCRLLATWIISQLDVRGVFYGDPAMVKSYVFPRRDDITIEQIEVYLKALEVGLIVRFEANGDLWQYWPGFAHNQVGLRTDRESPQFPAPPERYNDYGKDTGECPQDDGEMPEDCRRDAGEMPAEETGSEEKRNSAPSAAETPELTGEAALDAVFGERQPQAPTKARTPPPAGRPWRDWSGGAFRERDGVSVDAQDRVSWLVEDITGLSPPGNYTGWGNGAIACYIAGRGDWATIEAGIRNAWGREPQFRPSTLACTKRNADQNGFVKAIGKARAEVDRPPERAYSPLDAIPEVRADV